MSDIDPVRSQYEALPYPARDPGEEKSRLLRTWLDDLPMLNHYGFAGAHAFQGGFRVLVAGGGTGDATVLLAEQLRATDAEVVHLDFSRTSLAIARRRAEARGLANIRWVEASLLELPGLGLGSFDYINCVGVLHHLPDPDAGLVALLGSLARGGALGIMLYARTGRAGVYQMQDLLRRVTGGEAEKRKQIAQAREILAAVPPTHAFRRSESMMRDHLASDAGFFDLLLHPRDQAYSVDEVFAWFTDRHGLHLEFTDVQRGRSAYLPYLHAGPAPPRALARLRERPLREQYAIGELFTGTVQTHSFYATRAPQAAPYADPSYVPFFFHEPITGPQLAQFLASGRGQPVVLDHKFSGACFVLGPGRYGAAILERIDGRASWGEIFEGVRSGPGGVGSPPTDSQLFQDFAPIYEALNSIDRLLLKK